MALKLGTSSGSSNSGPARVEIRGSRISGHHTRSYGLGDPFATPNVGYRRHETSSSGRGPSCQTSSQKKSLHLDILSTRMASFSLKKGRMVRPKQFHRPRDSSTEMDGPSFNQFSQPRDSSPKKEGPSIKPIPMLIKRLGQINSEMTYRALQMLAVESP